MKRVQIVWVTAAIRAVGILVVLSAMRWQYDYRPRGLFRIDRWMGAVQRYLNFWSVASAK